jgi:hypothetical protein
MNQPRIFPYIVVAVSVWLTGCAPTEVKDLAQETRAASRNMALTHQQDLRTLASYDRARVAQFNLLLNNYFSLRVQVLNAFNQALEKSKDASLAELDDAFDQRAEQIMTVQFWAGFREESDQGLNDFLTSAKEKAVDQKTRNNAYTNDVESRNQSFLAARQLYLTAALNYEEVESSFAEMVLKIDQARADYHVANEKLFAQIQPLSLPDLPDDVKNFTLTNDTTDINQRISDLQAAYAKIDEGQELMIRYLDDNQGAEFLMSVGKAVVGISDASNSTTNNPVPISPADQGGTQLPGLDSLFDSLTSKIQQVQVQKNIGAGTLDQVISQLITNIKPIIPVNPAAAAGNQTPLNTQPASQP